MLVASSRNIFLGAVVSASEGTSAGAMERAMNRMSSAVSGPMMKRVGVAAAALLLAGIASAATATQAQDPDHHWSKTYQVNGRADLHVQSAVIHGFDADRDFAFAKRTAHSGKASHAA